MMLTELERSIYEAAGCEFNLADKKQVSEVMRDRLGISTDEAFFQWLRRTELERAYNRGSSRRLLDSLRWYR